jgi:uncharacterized protein
MMKFLLLLLVVAVGVFVFASRRRRADQSDDKADEKAHDEVSKAPAADAGTPAPMIACVHCGVHLPRSEAQADTTGRLFCSEAHRLAGPR